MCPVVIGAEEAWMYPAVISAGKVHMYPAELSTQICRSVAAALNKHALPNLAPQNCLNAAHAISVSK